MPAHSIRNTKGAGIEAQDAPRRVVRVQRAVAVGDAGRRASLVPGAGSAFSFEIAFDSKVMTERSGSVDLVDDAFKREISRARTFGFLHEVEHLRRLGLARGGSLENAVVINGDEVLNEEGLRFHDEFVRHKILDSIGDLYLAGHRIIGLFHGWKSGHALNNQLLRALFADASNYELDDMTAADLEEAEAWDYQPRRAARA
jgi:UDP-3-O-[3-hydroxymyristoyl] N-acetylglucosamine deacetylase